MFKKLTYPGFYIIRNKRTDTYLSSSTSSDLIFISMGNTVSTDIMPFYHSSVVERILDKWKFKYDLEIIWVDIEYTLTKI